MGQLRFGLLGPLEVTGPDGPVPVRGPKQRALLAALLLHEGRFVPVDVLLRTLWDDDPPDGALAQLQTRVWRLRRTLTTATDPATGGVDESGSAAGSGGGPEHAGIETDADGGGYRIVVTDGDIDAAAAAADAERGRALCRAARTAEAAEAFGAALARWRGPVLGGAVPAELAAAAARLEDERNAAVADLAEVELTLDRPADAAARLRPLVTDHPLDERARELLMRALAAAGRTADALESYRDGRSASVEELGIEPGPALRGLHAQLLHGAEPEERAAPGQLPPDVADFVGREKALAEAADRLGTGSEATDRLGTVAVSGAAGSGKTAFAVHLAHRVKDRFPDGQLFVDLHGVERPVEPADVLTRFLRALGDDPRTVPEDPDERAARYRERTAGRRLLVVLDDAAGEAQVRPLLPGGDGCAVLVTSRPRLAALEGAHVLDLPVFEPAEAAELLDRVAGPDRTRAEPEAGDALVELCGRLPLAIRVGAARLVARPHWTVRRLADQLADERGRLDALAAGDLDVRSSNELGHTALETL